MSLRGVPRLAFDDAEPPSDQVLMAPVQAAEVFAFAREWLAAGTDVVETINLQTMLNDAPSPYKGAARSLDEATAASLNRVRAWGEGRLAFAVERGPRVAGVDSAWLAARWAGYGQNTWGIYMNRSVFSGGGMDVAINLEATGTGRPMTHTVYHEFGHGYWELLPDDLQRLWLNGDGAFHARGGMEGFCDAFADVMMTDRCEGRPEMIDLLWAMDPAWLDASPASAVASGPIVYEGPPAGRLRRFAYEFGRGFGRAYAAEGRT